MLSRLGLFYLFFSVIGAKPAYETLVLEEIEGGKIIHNLESFDKILTKFVRHSSDIQQLAAAHSLEAHKSLALLPRECYTEGARHIEIERTKMLANYYKCSILQLLKDIASLGLDSAKYAYSVYKDTTVIVGDVVACTTAGFNPFTFIACIFKAVKVIPDEIKDLIAVTEEFEDSLDTLLPSIYHGIESCFRKTSSDYTIFLGDVLDKAKVCESRMIM